MLCVNVLEIMCIHDGYTYMKQLKYHLVDSSRTMFHVNYRFFCCYRRCVIQKGDLINEESAYMNITELLIICYIAAPSCAEPCHAVCV